MTPVRNDHETKQRKREPNYNPTPLALHRWTRSFAAAALAFACAALGIPDAQAQQQKPNIVLIMGDDIGWFNIGAYHQGIMSGKTPNLDRLAAEGTRFTDYYAEASCTAGRANFITGELPIRSGLTTVGQAGSPIGMPAQAPTIATALKSMGYATGQFGKNHLGDLNQFLPTMHGFDEFFGYLVLCPPERRLVRGDVARRPVGRGDVGAGRDLRHPAELAGALRHLRAGLRLDRPGGVRRLHARLLGTYVDPDGVVVYGTGYDYTPWIGSVWYGAPVTYGAAAAVTYTPWTGWAVGFGFGWAWGASTAGWAWGAYPWWGPMYGAAWGPYGAATWGAGGWAATTGNVYHQWGATTAVTRASGGFNAWTGNEWANHVGASYNSRTGTLAAGQRAAVGNVYTGNYAYGSRGAAVNTQTGAAVSGGRVTVGNAYTGQSASATRAQVYNPKTGQTSTWGVGHSGDDVYASHDGHVYQRDTTGDWQQHSWGGEGGWSHVQDSGATRSLDDEWASRFNGSERMNAFRSNFGEMGGRFGGGGFRR